MNLLIDANILLDVLENREPYVNASAFVWKLCETEQAKGYVPTLTFANLAYVMRKELDPQKIGEILKKLSLIFTFADFTGTDLVKAAELNWPDFEDAVQSVIAERVHADYIITRNVRDFAGSRIAALTPAELITERYR